MEKSSSNRLSIITAIIATLCAVFVIFLFVNSIPPCSIFDFGLHLKGCIHKLETIDTAYRLEYTSDSRFLMSSGFEAPIYLWSMPEAKRIHTLEGKEENPQQFGTISQNGKIIAIYSDANESITILDTQSLNPLEVIDQSLGWELEFSPRDPLLVYIGADEHIHLWNMTEKKDTTIENSSYPDNFSISPNGDTLASVALVDGDRVQLHSLPDGQLLRTIKFDSSVSAFAFTSDGKSLVTLTDGKKGSIVTFWTVANGNSERSLVLPNLGVNILALSPDNTMVAVAQKDCFRIPASVDAQAGVKVDHRCLTIWNTTTGKMVREIPLRETRILALAFSPDGEQLAVAIEESIYIWETP